MKLIKDDMVWKNAWLDMPMNFPIDPESAHAAMMCPGCCVKSKEKDGGIGFPKYCGRLAALDKEKDEVMVISHPEDIQHEGRRVWTGTVKQYLAMWDCD